MLASSRNARRLGLLALALGLIATGRALGLTYWEDLDDKTALPMQERLDLLDRRVQRLHTLEAEGRERNATLEAAIARGKRTAAQIEEQRSWVASAAASSTLGDALGDGAARGLAWQCTRARGALPHIERLATTIGTELRGYPAQVNAIEIGEAGSVAALRNVHARLDANVRRVLTAVENEQLRADLREIAAGLPHDWGGYTTLKQMSDDLSAASKSLDELVAATRATSAELEVRITRWLEERPLIETTLTRIDPEFAADIARRDALRKRWETSRLPALAADPLGTVTSARNYASLWEDASATAQRAAQSALTRIGAAAAACGDWGQPARDFTAARVLAEQPLAEQLIRIDETYAARAEQLRRARAQAEDVRRVSQETVAEIDRKTRAAPAGSNAAQVATARTLRADAQTEALRMGQVVARLDAEDAIVREQRAAVAAIKPQLLPAGE